MNYLPEEFLTRLEQIIPGCHFGQVKAHLMQERACSFRINPLKADLKQARARLDQSGIEIQPIPPMENAYFCDTRFKSRLIDHELIHGGHIYLQAASSMFAAKTLNPSKSDRVLDMCAAPGSKTSQCAAMMENDGELIALEAVKGRFFKLKAVLDLLGVKNTRAKLCDARRFRPRHLVFDKILVDAPCSSEGRFNAQKPKSFAYWSVRKIKEMQRKQKSLLFRGLELLGPGGELVYSTCTFAPEENEEVVTWALEKMGGRVGLAVIETSGITCYPPINRWGRREYHPQIEKCVRILPSGIWGAFFVVKFRRIK